MNALKKFSFLCLSSLLSFSIVQAQQYRDNAVYVKMKESTKVSAKSFGRDVVPLSSLGLKISQTKNNRFGLHQEAYSLSLFDNPILDKTFQIQFDSTSQIDKIIRILEKDPNVEYVERIPIFKLYGIYPGKAATDTAPDDPFYQPIGNVNPQWYLDMVNAPGAWALQTGDSNIIAAIVDGAVWGEHPELQIPTDLQYNAGTGAEGNSAPPSNVTQDEECSILYSDDPNASPCPSYSWSHGTHCAGVVGATNNNGQGIASLASGVTLMGVAAHLPQYPDAVYNGDGGIRWAANNGARVINCSWGGGSLSTSQETLLTTCYENGIVVVAAAGNDNTDEPSAPASSPHVISVGSVDETGRKSSFSNYGPWVSITAPGGFSHSYLGILSTTFCLPQYLRLYNEDIYNNGGFEGQYYDIMTGTSMASPLVASLCALMLSRDPDLSPGEIKDILQNTSTYSTSNRNYFMPLAGTINAEAAIKAVDEARYDAPVSNLSFVRQHLDTVWIEWDAPTGYEHEILSYNVFRNGTLLDSMVSASATSYMDTLVEGGRTSYMVSVNYSDGYKSYRQEIVEEIKATYEIRTVIVPRNSEAGIVTGGGMYEDRSRCLLEATANPGYEFERWYTQGETVSTRPYYNFIVRGDQVVNAIFKEVSSNEDQLAASMSLNPNPVQDILSLTSPTPIDALVIYDLQGRKIKELDGNRQTEIRVDVSFLPQGNYILDIITPQGKIQKKFIKL